jgi:glycerophosphoryl diester phosphodiesterase
MCRVRAENAGRIGWVLASLAAIALAFVFSDRVDGAIRGEARRPPGPSWRDVPRPWVIGHRGGGADALDEPLPENTIASAKAALAEGATGVELDATLTRDGQLLLLHDPDLDRTTTCSGCASELTMNDIRACRTVTPVESSGAAATHDERPPTLTEAMTALAASPRRPLVVIDAKLGARHGCPAAIGDTEAEAKAFAAAIASAMRAAPHVDVAVTGPLELLAAARREQRTILTLLGPTHEWRLIAAGSAVGVRDSDDHSENEGLVEIGAATRFDGVAVPIDDVDRVAGAARAQGRLVDAYVANDAEAALEAARQGADFIETDRVRDVLIALGRLEPRAAPTR